MWVCDGALHLACSCVLVWCLSPGHVYVYDRAQWRTVPNQSTANTLKACASPSKFLQPATTTPHRPRNHRLDHHQCQACARQDNPLADLARQGINTAAVYTPCPAGS